MNKDLETRLERYEHHKLAVISHAQYEALVRRMQDAREYEDEVNATFDPILKAQNEVLRVTRQQKKRFTDRIDAFKDAARAALNEWSENTRKLTQELQINKEDIFAVVPSYVEPVPRVSGSYQRETYKYEVVDEEAVPRAFLRLDEAKVRAHIADLKEYANIPGIRVIVKIDHTIRRKK